MQNCNRLRAPPQHSRSLPAVQSQSDVRYPRRPGYNATHSPPSCSSAAEERRTNPRQEHFEKEASEMENGGKGDVPQDANERKNPLPRAMHSTIISSSSPFLLWVWGRLCGRLVKERGEFFLFSSCLIDEIRNLAPLQFDLSKLGSRVLVLESLNMLCWVLRRLSRDAVGRCGEGRGLRWMP
jgi:hypothetical protein